MFRPPTPPYCKATLCTFRSKNIGGLKETIMKKTYINPEIEVVKLATQQMLAMSVSETEVDGNKALGRDFDFDDEE